MCIDKKNPATMALFENLLAICHKYGLGSLTESIPLRAKILTAFLTEETL